MVPRPAAARDVQRLRAEAVQRRHRRRRRRGGARDAGRVRARRRVPAPARPEPVVRRPDRARDDRPPQPGQPVRAGVAGAAAGRVTAADPRAVLHSGHPRFRIRARAGQRSRRTDSGRASDPPGERAASPLPDELTGPLPLPIGPGQPSGRASSTRPLFDLTRCVAVSAQQQRANLGGRA